MIFHIFDKALDRLLHSAKFNKLRLDVSDVFGKAHLIPDPSYGLFDYGRDEFCIYNCKKEKPSVDGQVSRLAKWIGGR